MSGVDPGPDDDAGGVDALNDPVDDEDLVDAVQTRKVGSHSSAASSSFAAADDENRRPSVADRVADAAGAAVGSWSMISRKISLQRGNSATRFLDTDGKIATREHMIEYLTLQRFSRDGCAALPLTTLLWVILAILISDRAHTETSFRIRDAVSIKMGNLTARSTRGVAPAFIVSQDEGTGTACRCSCALETKYLCEEAPSLQAFRFAGDVAPEQLHILRARDAHYQASENNQGNQQTLQLADVSSIDDVWFWIQHGLVPELWHEEGRDAAVDVSNIFTGSDASTSPSTASADPTGARTPGFFLPWTQVVGGLRMRQRRVQVDSCRTDDRITSRYQLTCHSTEASVTPFGPGLESEADGFIPAESDSEAFDVYLDVGRAEHWALETIQYMLRRHNWLDGDTHSLTLQMVLLNGEAKPALFGLVELTFTFQLSGGLHQKLAVYSTAADPWAMHYLYLDIAWVLLVICLYAKATVQLFQRWLERKSAKPTAEALFSVWDCLEWSAIVASIILLVNHFVLAADSLDLADSAAGLPSVPSTGATAESIQDYHRQWGNLVDRVARNVAWWEYHRLALFGYTIVLTLQFFKIFRGQPKLAHIARVLINATEDLIHFVIVFLVLFFNFAFSGFMIYGLVLEDWSTPGGAINSAFRALMGDVDLSEMYKFAPFSTVLWFSMFVFAMIFVMLNLLIAIVFDHYEIVKDDAGAVTGIFLQLQFFFADLKDRSDGSCFRCMCCCCRRSSLPSHKKMVEALAAGEGISHKELQAAQLWVTGHKKMWKETARNVATLSCDPTTFTRSVQDAMPDLKPLVADPDYLESLKSGCLAYTLREYNPQEAKLQLLRELVSISEEDIVEMRQRLAECGFRSKRTMNRFQRRIDAVEELVHTSLMEIVEIAEHAGVPTGSVETKSPAKKAQLDATMGSLRSLGKEEKTKAMLSSSLKPVLQGLGQVDKKTTLRAGLASNASTVTDWHKADSRIDTHHKRAGPAGASRRS
jgi:hypothetical protein